MMHSNVTNHAASAANHTFWCTRWMMHVILSASTCNSTTFLVLCCCWVHNATTCCCNFFIFAALSFFLAKGNFFISFFSRVASVSTVHSWYATFYSSTLSINAFQVQETCSTTLAHNASTSSIFFTDFVVSILVS